MVKTEIDMKILRALLPLLLIAAACNTAPKSYYWERFDMDGHRTGVTVPAADNVPEALGTLYGKAYKAPNGRTFRGGSTPEVASLLIGVQPEMAYLKEAIAFAPEGLARYAPESPLSNFIVDHLKAATERITGKHVDVAITNFGGIRCDLPKGNVLLDDVVSMLPFSNYATWLLIPGSELRKVFEQMAETRPQCVSGAELVIENGRLVSAKIGGKPIDDRKYYSLATIDFMMDGGDGYKLARGARDFIITDKRIGDIILEDIRAITAAGEQLTYATDGRVRVQKTGDKLLAKENAPAAEAEPAPTRKPRLVIMHCNDTHSHFDPFPTEVGYRGGIVERAAFADSIRRVYPASKVLFLHAGDFNQGSSYYSELGGSLEPKMINALGYDCITLGNHELDNGIEDLAARLSKIDCPIVCANCEFPDTLQKYVEPYTIIRRGGMKIGIIGMESDIATMVAAPTAQRVQQYDNVETILKWAPYLKEEEGCDMVILLSHLGYGEDQSVIAQVRGVDLVIGGHTHTFVKDFVYTQDLDGHSVPIITDGCWGREMGLVKVY